MRMIAAFLLMLVAQPVAGLALHASLRSAVGARRASSPACQFKMPWDAADDREEVAAPPPPPPEKKNPFASFMDSLVRSQRVYHRYHMPL